jgi:hypothetical protein
MSAIEITKNEKKDVEVTGCCIGREEAKTLKCSALTHCDKMNLVLFTVTSQMPTLADEVLTTPVIRDGMGARLPRLSANCPG